MDHKLTWNDGVPTIEDMMTGYSVTGVRECVQYLTDMIVRGNELLDEYRGQPEMIDMTENNLWCFAKHLKNVLACHE